VHRHRRLIPACTSSRVALEGPRPERHSEHDQGRADEQAEPDRAVDNVAVEQGSESIDNSLVRARSLVLDRVVNLTDQPAELIVVYTPGGCHKFYEELGPATRTASPDRAEIAAIFEHHGMSLLGPPLSAT